MHKGSIFRNALNNLTLRELRDIVKLRKLGLLVLVLKTFRAQRTAFSDITLEAFTDTIIIYVSTSCI